MKKTTQQKKNKMQPVIFLVLSSEKKVAISILIQQYTIIENDKLYVNI